jgi:hypothetical protein
LQDEVQAIEPPGERHLETSHHRELEVVKVTLRQALASMFMSPEPISAPAWSRAKATARRCAWPDDRQCN